MNSKRVIKTPEQLSVLKSLYGSGMVDGKSQSLIAEASQRTGLTESVIKDWIYNQGKPNRGIKKKRGHLNVYTAFLSRPFACPFNIDGSKLGQLAKLKSIQYKALKATPDGRKELEDNLKKSIAAFELKPEDKGRRIRGIYGSIKKELEELEALGCKAVALVAHPNKSSDVLGEPSAKMFIQRREHLLKEFDLAMFNKDQGSCTGTGTSAAVDTKKELRLKVQLLFNKLYAQALGKPVSAVHVPYTAIAAGQLQVTVEGLPEGISFRKPNFYSLAQMKAILASKGLQFNLGSHEERNTCNTGVPNTSSDVDCTVASESVTVPSETDRSETMEALHREDSRIDEAAAILDRLSRGQSLQTDNEGGEFQEDHVHTSSKVVKLEDVQEPKLVIKKLQAQQLKKSTLPIVGQKVKWLFEELGQYAWHRGVVKSVNKTSVVVLFKTDMYKTSVKEFLKYQKNGTLKLIN